jgi:hypothetical protein
MIVDKRQCKAPDLHQPPREGRHRITSETKQWNLATEMVRR